ncbi:DNA translocase FtsK [Oenococcus sp. UCMA 16435]|nr:DNA translocase FtsK [Oenococcus sp. UCMA 16435]MDI4584905.1 cell division protein FtsK [Oenococcus sp. UCMA 14587]
MATRRRRKTKKTQKINSKTILILAIEVLFVLGIFRLGIIGNFFANIYKYVFGNYFVIFILLIAFFLGYWLLYKKLPKIPTRIIVGIIFLALPFLTISSLFFDADLHNSTNLLKELFKVISNDMRHNRSQANVGGGLIGAVLYLALSQMISNVGVWIVSILSVIFGLFRLFDKSVLYSISKVTQFCRERISKFQDKRANNSKNPQRKNFLKKYFQDGNAKDEEGLVSRTTTTTEEVQPKIRWNQVDSESNSNRSTRQNSNIVPDNPLSNSNQNSGVGNLSNAPTDFDDKISKEIDDDQIIDSIETIDNPNYKVPPFSVLSHIQIVDQTSEYKQLTKKSQIVRDTLKSFNIDTEVSSVSLGPTVTQYELKPARGVKVSTIANRADDLALALSAKSIRIEAPIPGKPFVGVEVPNEVQATVGFSDIIEHSQFNPKHPLTVPLGRDVNNDVVSADLSAMPHLLIAGATGSGKSVAINGIISSLLMRLKPNEVKLMMVDPKRVELSMYNDLPHLLAPVISEPRKAARGLQKAVKEMERRYELFADHGVRNIDGWNQKVLDYNKTKGHVMPKMPYIVIIVDELADLMMTAKSDVETAIVRIAQMGRAAGVHLILATQRPSVDVITGLIKANVPSRIAFAVSSGIDSRTILDQNGAEKLLGKGDMLFAPVGKEPMRIQGAFIPDRDVETITNYIREESSAQYASSMLVEDGELADNANEETGANGEPVDDLFNEASDFVIQQKKASTSLLQRRFRIGYNRAARIIDDLEAAGIVGPQDGSRPREVLVSDKNTKD